MRCLKNGLIIQAEEGYSVRYVGPSGRRGREETKVMGKRRGDERNNRTKKVENEAI